MVLPNAGSSSMEPILDLGLSIPFMIHPKGVSILNGIFLFAVTTLHPLVVHWLCLNDAQARGCG